MESRIRVLFLKAAATLALVTSVGIAPLVLAETSEQVVRPEIERREVHEADIDTEDFEVGIFGGLMNVEDFGTNPVYGARAAYHVSEYIFVEGAYARTSTEESSAERLSGFQIVSDRDLDYYNLSFGFNILPGESFIGSKWAFTSDFYVIGGAGSTSFGGNDEFTWNAGFGYRLLVNDWLALRVDARDHVFNVDLLGESKTNHNLEFTGGLSIFF
ncbi:MAG TPA: outer membrane beta-barrel domain-containing protein [Gammaproteobacteria bacterium]|nr:outer membrane beta-barrel domain-containing protein [Gammaproteobacteria bacterium]